MTTAPSAANREEGLRECPFCGSASIDADQWMDGDNNTVPGCDDCGACAESVEAWNRRATPPRAESGGVPWSGKLHIHDVGGDFQSVYADDYGFLFKARKPVIDVILRALGGEK